VSSGPFQYAIAEALALPDSYFTAFRDNIRPLGESDGFAFCRALPERAGVVAIPNAVFYDHRQAGAPFVRFAFCKRTGVLEDAVQRLKTLAG
jgi:N-succinyldiaminopimelate aminotransferase